MSNQQGLRLGLFATIEGLVRERLAVFIGFRQWRDVAKNRMRRILRAQGEALSCP